MCCCLCCPTYEMPSGSDPRSASRTPKFKPLGRASSQLISDQRRRGCTHLCFAPVRLLQVWLCMKWRTFMEFDKLKVGADGFSVRTAQQEDSWHQNYNFGKAHLSLCPHRPISTSLFDHPSGAHLTFHACCGWKYTDIMLLNKSFLW